MARATSSKNPEEKRHPGVTKLRINDVKTRVRKDCALVLGGQHRAEAKHWDGNPNPLSAKWPAAANEKHHTKGVTTAFQKSFSQRRKIILGRSTRNLVTRGTRAEGIVTKKARRKTRKTVSNMQREKVIIFETTLKKKRWSVYDLKGDPPPKKMSV